MPEPVDNMPWKGIAKVTGGVAAVVGSLLSAACAADIRRQRREYEESQRVHWTDKNRWE